MRVCDAKSGRQIYVMAFGAPAEAAALDFHHNKIIWATPGAWRFLGWRVEDKKAGRTRILPAETFGPLPA